MAAATTTRIAMIRPSALEAAVAVALKAVLVVEPAQQPTITLSRGSPECPDDLPQHRVKETIESCKP